MVGPHPLSDSNPTLQCSAIQLPFLLQMRKRPIQAKAFTRFKHLVPEQEFELTAVLVPLFHLHATFVCLFVC